MTKVWLGEGPGVHSETGAEKDVEVGICGPGGIPSEISGGEDGVGGQHQ